MQFTPGAALGKMPLRHWKQKVNFTRLTVTLQNESVINAFPEKRRGLWEWSASLLQVFTGSLPHFLLFPPPIF